MKGAGFKSNALTGLFVVMTMIALTGCAPVISKGVLAAVDRTIAFKDLQQAPAGYKGREVLFGGVIVTVENRAGMTYVEVMQQPLNSRLKPVNPANTQGRFIAVFKGFKDPAVYVAARFLTVAGKVSGSLTRPLGKMDYEYPLVDVIEDHLWPSLGESTGTGVSFGLGLGVYR